MNMIGNLLSVAIASNLEGFFGDLNLQRLSGIYLEP